jgi:hypothetical protein
MIFRELVAIVDDFQGILGIGEENMKQKRQQGEQIEKRMNH